MSHSEAARQLKESEYLMDASQANLIFEQP
jgi:hypothetical protein